MRPRSLNAKPPNSLALLAKTRILFPLGHQSNRPYVTRSKPAAGRFQAISSEGHAALDGTGAVPAGDTLGVGHLISSLEQ